MMAIPPGPYKPFDPLKVGEAVQGNYWFLDKLFAPGGNAYRQSILAMNDNQLRQELSEYGLDIPQGVRLVVVDLETATLQPVGGALNAQDPFYQLVMPPAPRRHAGNAQYRHDQQWEDAWYHAIVDSYGM
jgi:hypothetical protein